MRSKMFLLLLLFVLLNHCLEKQFTETKSPRMKQNRFMEKELMALVLLSLDSNKSTENSPL